MGVRWLRLWRLGIVPLASWDPDFPGSRPTHLPRGNQRPGPPTLPRHPIVDLPQLGQRAPKGSALANYAWSGRAHGGTGISTSCPSTTPFGLALGPD